MNFNLKLKKIRTFRKMTQKELSEKIGLTDQHRIVQYEKGVRVPKKDLVDKMAKALDVNPYTLYDTAGRDASEMMELLFWLDEFNPSALHLFLPRKFPGEKKFRISLEFFFLSVQTVAIYLHGCRHSGIYIAFNLFILHNFPRNITPFHSPNYFQYIFSILTHFSVNRIIKIDSEHICYQNIARPPLATYK